MVYSLASFMVSWMPSRFITHLHTKEELKITLEQQKITDEMELSAEPVTIEAEEFTIWRIWAKK